VSGQDVIRKVRRDMSLMRLPIIVLTAKDDDQSQSETIDLGADDYIVKPFKPAIVFSRINAAFRRAEN
jgi:two-component system phosphate regulon response regulator PhoB